MRRSGTFASRTLLGDGTRQFRYNYRNQLRKVWRKSDGDSDGLISQYREDAFGRRVLTHSWWELARRVYLDTRFELDINMDAPGGSGGVSKYINGGITSDGPMEARAEWESRIYRTHGELDTHYYDFLVNIPQAEESTDYLGMLGVAHYELRIYGDRYELWDASGPTMIDSYSATTAGWRNIGLRAGINEGVWVDGNKIIDYGVPMGGNLPVAFSTLGVNEGNGIELYECLTYLRSYNRSQAEISNVPGGEVGGYPIITGQSHPPRVKRPFFDGPAAVTVIEVVADSGGSSASDELCTEYEEDGTRARHFFHDGEYTDLYLPNVRRQAALVIRDDADSLVDNEGTLHVHSDEYPLPGVIMVNHFDAVGQPLGYVTPDPFNESYPWGAQGNNVFACPTYGHDDHTLRLGIGQNLFIDKSTHATSNPLAALVTGDNAETDQAAEGEDQCDTGECCFRQHAANESYDTTQIDTPTGAGFNGHGGNLYDYPPGIVLGVGHDGPTVAEVFRHAPRPIVGRAPPKNTIYLPARGGRGKRGNADGNAGILRPQPPPNPIDGKPANLVDSGVAEEEQLRERSRKRAEEDAKRRENPEKYDETYGQGNPAARRASLKENLPKQKEALAKKVNEAWNEVFANDPSSSGPKATTQAGKGSADANAEETAPEPQPATSAAGGGKRGGGGTVYDDIKPTGDEVAPGVPKSAEFTLGTGDVVWVSANAIKHIAEYIYACDAQHKMNAQTLLTMLHDVLTWIHENGIVYGSLYVVDGWEVVIEKQGKDGRLPVVTHAVYRPNGDGKQ